MKTPVPYLMFKGKCREAMNFYRDCFGGKLEVMAFADGPPEACGPEIKDKNLVMHAFLKNEAFVLMASDDPIGTTVNGSNVQLSVECESMAQLEKLFQQLSGGGKTNMPLADAFWGARFGMVTDKFGISWMLSFPLK